MTRSLQSLCEIASDYEAIVLDQWGVLHDGSAPYPYAVRALTDLKEKGHGLAVLSNSGKRAEPNEAQLSRLGFARELFACVMTSGEALWRAFAAGDMRADRLHAITRAPDDAQAWAKGLDISFVSVAEAEAVLLMGLSDSAPAGAFDDVLTAALGRGLPLLCSNPDRTAPRAGGVTVIMPGTLADSYAARGGEVRYIGKPHLPIFRAVEAVLDLPPEKILMVGDSLEHDIAGAHAAGWHSLLIRGGLHAESFRAGASEDTVAALALSLGTPLPDFALDIVR